MNQKGFIPILILIFIGLVAIGGYWFLNQQKKSIDTSQSSIQTQVKPSNNKDKEIIPNNLVKPITKQTKFSFLREGDVWVNDNNNQTKITDYKHNYSIVLSPNLSKIAYLSVPLDQIKFAESVGHIGGLGLTRNIWLINFDGNNPRKLTSSPGYFSELKFSPNGKYLAYINRASNKLLVIDLDTGNTIMQQVIDGLWARYRWNTDNNSLVIAAKTKTNSPSDLVGINIFKVDLSSQKLSKIGLVAPFFNSSTRLDYSISPDLRQLSYFGEKLNYISLGVADYDLGLWIANLDGTNSKEILVKKGAARRYDIKFSWSPDGSYLAFSFFGELYEVKVYEVNTGKLYTATASHIFFMTWDQNNNLYLQQFVPNDGVNDYISRVDFKTGQLEKFLDNTTELSFGN